VFLVSLKITYITSILSLIKIDKDILHKKTLSRDSLSFPDILFLVFLLENEEIPGQRFIVTSSPIFFDISCFMFLERFLLHLIRYFLIFIETFLQRFVVTSLEQTI